MTDLAPRRPSPARRPGSRLALLSLARPRLTLALLALLFAVAGVLGGPVASLLQSGGGFSDPSSESARASAQLEAATGVSANGSMIVLVHAGQNVQSGPGRALVETVAARLRAEAGVAQVIDPYTSHSAALVSLDGTSAYLVGYVRGSSTAAAARAQQIATDLQADNRVVAGGFLIASKQVGDQVSKDIGRAEIVAFPLLFVVLVLVLRGLLVALLPIGVGMVTVLVTFMGLRLVNAEITPMSIFAVNLVTGLGLGLALDYGLLILNRYREEAVHTGYGRDALLATLGSAGRTVLFSSLTVAAAMAALLVFPQEFLYSMGTGGIIAAPVAAFVALALLPSVLLVLGPRIERAGWFRLEHEVARPAGERGFWWRLSTFTMGRPVVVAVTTAVVMLLLASPVLRIQFTSVDAGILPRSTTGRQVDDALKTQFPTYAASPIVAVVSAPASASAAVAGYAGRLATLPGVVAVNPPRYEGSETWAVDVVNGRGPLEAASQALVSSVRSAPAAYPVLVGGDAANFKDLQASLRSHIPTALLLVAATTLVILFVMTGSVVLPVKSLLMNLLSVGAAFGILVLVFQDGRLTGPLAYESQGGLESTQPILLFAIAFGLSTDYGVFLLQRIKEGHDAGLDTTAAVAAGMQRTGRIVTSAAFLFCIAIGAFASSSIVFIKEVGVGTALAVFIDATIVRGLLVPSLMALLGRWNWWAPRPLRALHHRLGLDRLEDGGTAPGRLAPSA